MAVRGTTNYVYFTDRSLGVGATGNVYFGRHKVGQLVVVSIQLIDRLRLCTCSVIWQSMITALCNGLLEHSIMIASIK